jgi:hypothetical protein
MTESAQAAARVVETEFKDVRILANTYTGRVFNPLRPDPAVICIEDIAHSSSGMARYFRHTDRLYSTAQHSVILSHLVDPQDALGALLHDGDETYIGDPIAPLKRQSFMAPFRALSELWIHTIYAVFGAQVHDPERLRALDEQIRVNEMRDLYKVVPAWALEATPLPLNGRAIQPWSAWDAEARFLARFHELKQNARPL